MEMTSPKTFMDNGRCIKLVTVPVRALIKGGSNNANSHFGQYQIGLVLYLSFNNVTYWTGVL